LSALARLVASTLRTRGVGIEGWPIKTNYVLIDYENVQPEIVAALADDHLKVLVFIGTNQTRIDVGVAAALQALGARAQYVRV
jgi:hypothetical protein